jgi:hypothetical protein
MNLEEYRKKGIYELGETVITHVNNHYKNNDENELSCIYNCLIAIGMKVLYEDTFGVEEHIIDEWVYHIAEDTVMMIRKNPGKFIGHDNFFFYYKSALRISSKKMIAQKYSILENFDSLEYDKEDYPLFSIVDNTDAHLIKRDECRMLVEDVLRILKKFPRLSKNAKYLVWPVLYSILNKSDEMLNYPNQRDRLTLRLVLSLVEQNITGKLHDLTK